MYFLSAEFEPAVQKTNVVCDPAKYKAADAALERPVNSDILNSA